MEMKELENISIIFSNIPFSTELNLLFKNINFKRIPFLSLFALNIPII